MELENPKIQEVAALGRATTEMSGLNRSATLKFTRSAVSGTPALLTKWQALFNFVSGCVGAGLLVLPKTVSRVGWLPGLGLLCLVTVVSTTSCHLVHRAMKMNSGARCAEDLGMQAYGPMMRNVVLVFNSCDLFAGCVILLVGGGDLASIIFGPAYQTQCILGVFVVVAMLSLPKDLSGLAKAALAGVITLFMFLVVYLADGLIAILGPDRATDQVLANLDMSTLAGAAAIIGLSYCGAILTPSLHAEMADIHELPWVLNVGHAIIFIVYTSMPIVGYAGYGGEGLDKVPELSSLANLPWAPAFCACCASVTLMVGYPLFLNPIVTRIEALLNSSPGRELPTRLGVRLTMAGLTLFVALTIPYFYEIVHLTGAVTTNTMCMLLPVAYYVKSVANERAAGKLDNTPSTIIKCLIVLTLTQGLLVMLVGVYYGVLDLAEAIERGGEAPIMS